MSSSGILTAPSILSADFARMADGLDLMKTCGADWVHIDVMDGVFVPPITFGSQMVAALKSATDLPLDVHLMTVHPDRHLEAFIEAGADMLTFHLEADIHAHRTVQRIRAAGRSPGRGNGRPPSRSSRTPTASPEWVGCRRSSSSE